MGLNSILSAVTRFLDPVVIPPLKDGLIDTGLSEAVLPAREGLAARIKFQDPIDMCAGMGMELVYPMSMAALGDPTFRLEYLLDGAPGQVELDGAALHDLVENLREQVAAKGKVTELPLPGLSESRKE